MSKSQNLFFRFVEGDALGACNFEGFAEFFGQDPQVDDDAEIVKQSRKISLAGIGIGNLAGEMAADERASQRMFPKGDRVNAAAVLGHHVEHPARHGNVANPVKSESDNCATQRVDLLPAPEQRAVRHLQTLGGQGFVLRNHGGDFLHVKHRATGLEKIPGLEWSGPVDFRSG